MVGEEKIRIESNRIKVIELSNVYLLGMENEKQRRTKEFEEEMKYLISSYLNNSKYMSISFKLWL